MSTESISRRYARALFELDREGVKLAGKLAELAEAASADEVRAFLETPHYPAEVKVAVLEKSVKGLTPETERLVRLLAERGKAVLLPEIHALFDEMVREAESAVVADVSVATEIKDSVRKKLARAIEESVGGKVELHVHTDPDMLGGLVVRLGDRQIDASLRTRLNSLRRAIAA